MLGLVKNGRLLAKLFTIRWNESQMSPAARKGYNLICNMLLGAVGSWEWCSRSKERVFQSWSS